MTSPSARLAPDWQVQHILQGEFAVSRLPTDCFSTLLGSCVATCLWDPVRRIGGMNHYLLPDGGPDRMSTLRYGVNAMELLVNGMLKRGAQKRDLVAKLFGGARMLHASSDIGRRNCDFARQFLRDEGIEIIGASLGGRRGRRLRFFPAEGRVQQRFIDPSDMPSVPFTRVPPKNALPQGGEVELF